MCEDRCFYCHLWICYVVRNKIMYVLLWQPVYVLTRVLFWCVFPLLLCNSGNKHQNNPHMSAYTIYYSCAIIILYIHVQEFVTQLICMTEPIFPPGFNTNETWQVKQWNVTYLWNTQHFQVFGKKCKYEIEYWDLQRILCCFFDLMCAKITNIAIHSYNYNDKYSLWVK